MRRFQDSHRSHSLFRGAELPRLLTMVVMLGVLWLLIDRARDARTWQWLAPADDARQLATSSVARPRPGSEADLAPDAGPTDEDPQELDAAREEFQAVTDKAPLVPAEMPAYWRLMAWQQHQSTEELLGRAQRDVTFRDLWHDPQRWRGKLVEIPLHLRRTERLDDLAQNPLDFTSIYEVWGWNSDSQPYWYWLVCPQLPPGMSEGQSIYEEATFVGYFLKLLPYEDHEGKMLATPLLIGRLVWHPEAANPLSPSGEWSWPWILAAALVVVFALRWGLTLAGRRPTVASRSPLGLDTPDREAVETWLDGAQDQPETQNPRGARWHERGQEPPAGPSTTEQ